MIEILQFKGSWKIAYDLALHTISKKSKNYPTEEWKKKILAAEHSPIRSMWITVRFLIPYYVSVHFVRHKIGVEHFVTTQRTDRTKIDRGSKRQDSLVEHVIDMNFLAVINISRKRLCGQADPATRQVWIDFLAELRKWEPELVDSCLPECEYRGGKCNEFKSCKKKKEMPNLQKYKRI